MTPKLIGNFCRDWIEWVEDGCPISLTFDPGLGLCSLYTIWCAHNGYLQAKSQCIPLLHLMRADGMYSPYPFNNGVSGYMAETEQSTCHANEKRLAWARKHATKRTPCEHEYEPIDGGRICVNCNHHI